MLFGDNMYFGNTAVDTAYLGDTQVWSAIPAAVKAHIARVTADGGTVPEQAKMVSMVKKLIAANLWNNCVFFGLPLGGVKKDGNQFVSKVYDLKSNADLLQATETRQPKYNNGSLLYDGSDYLENSVVSSNILNANSNVTVIFWLKGQSTTVFQSLFSLANIPTGNFAWYITNNTNNKMRVRLGINGSTAIQKGYASTKDIFTGEWVQCAFTYSANTLKLYINGIYDTPIISQNNNIGDLSNVTTLPIGVGGFANGANLIVSGNKIDMHQIYNSTFSPEQMLWNFNNIRPEGV